MHKSIHFILVATSATPEPSSKHTLLTSSLSYHFQRKKTNKRPLTYALDCTFEIKAGFMLL